MDVILDIETVPAADKEPFITQARENFRAPGSLTKGQAAADLGLSEKDAKFTGKDELIAQWEKAMAEQKAPEVADAAWRKTSFDGTQGRVVSIAWSAGGQERAVALSPDREAETLTAFFGELPEYLDGRPPFFVGHRIVFDLKFLWRRAVILNIRPPFDLPFRGRHGHHYFCTMEAWGEHKETISMDNLAKALGLPGKGDVDGSMVCDMWLAGDYDKIRAYNLDDVRKTKAIYDRLNFVVPACDRAKAA